MKKFIKNFVRGKNNNNSGMTLVEVIVATAIFGILASMVAFLSYSSMKNQHDTEKWNNQTDAQTSFLSEHRYDTDADIMDNDVAGGGTQYKMQIKFSDTTINSNDVDMYYIETQHPTNEDGNQIPTDEDVHIKFFRVS